MNRSADDLRGTLLRIDGRGYKAYKDLRGAYALGPVTLFVDHVQGDPFASPSKLRLRVEVDEAGIPPELSATRVRRIALRDFLARQARRALRRGEGRRRGSGRSGVIHVDAGGQEVLERSAALVTERFVELRVQAGLPAAGRRVLGREAEEMLCGDLPQLAERALLWRNLPQAEARRFVECVENQEHLRALLPERGLVAFVGDGSVLPRESGASDRPLPAAQAVAFRSPEPLRVTLPLANPVETERGLLGEISGMGLRRGVTLVVGGGYHGKSTLLKALERAVYPHVPGDGREWVVSDAGLVKIRAEDGRRVEQVDISAFIGDLPQGRSTTAFSSEDASGSTSQAANIVEAVEAGATGLLLDEDTSATNFMIRDARMQALVHKEDEPITPFLERVRELADTHGVSTVLVMGGCGDYFEVADTVISMREFLPEESTEEAKRIAERTPSGRRAEASAPFGAIVERVPLAHSFDASRGRREVKIDTRALDLVLFGTDTIDLRCVEQLVDVSQTRAVGHALHLAATRFMDGRASLREVVEKLEDFFDAQGLDALDPFHRGGHHPGNFARPRGLEVAAAINRLRTLRMRQRR
jgi:predicted ABC-class ATPase